MADKEERITIHRVLYPCKKCSINCNKNDWKDCDFYQNYISGITRQEAINRMANALHYRSTVISDMEKDWGKLDESWRDSFCKYAEAALNALLEEK